MGKVFVYTVLIAFMIPGCSDGEDDDRDFRDSGDSIVTGEASADNGTVEDSGGGDSGDGSSGTSSNQEELSSLAGQIRDAAKLDSCTSDDDCVQLSYGCSFVVYTPRVTDEEKLKGLIFQYNNIYWENREDQLCPSSGVFNYRCVENECTDVGSNW